MMTSGDGGFKVRPVNPALRTTPLQSGMSTPVTTLLAVLLLHACSPIGALNALAPRDGISVTRDIVGQTSLDLRISPDLHQMDARLFRPEPMCLKLLERTA